MKLISCYIENYGGLQEFSYDFKEGLNIIQEENGWGKSTLASFLKAMFYGLERTTKRSLDENERKKYEPWNGGAYGGNLTFEVEKNQYRVERFFGSKDKEDTFKLYDVNTGLESYAYTDNLGEELFGIDRGAFEQSIFMKQGMYHVTLTDSVATKMSGLMASGDDRDCYEKACERIDAEMKLYKKIGNKGKIAELTEEIAEWNRRIAEAKQTGASLSEWKKRAEQCRQEAEILKSKKTEIKTKMRRAGEQAALLEKGKHYRQLLSEKEKLGREIDELDRFFRKGLPSEEELELYRNKLFLLRSKKERVQEETPDFRYPGLVSLMKKNPVTEEELDACEQKWNSLSEKEESLEAKKLQIQTIKIREEEKQIYLQEKADGLLVRQRVFTILMVLVLVAAVVLFFVLDKVYALAAAGVAVVCLVLVIASGIKRRQILSEIHSDNEELQQLAAEADELKQGTESVKKAVRTYLQAFLMGDEDEIPSCINRLRMTLMEVRAQENKNKQQQQAEEKYLHEQKTLREELILFQRRFYADAQEVEEFLLKEIEQKRNEYLNLSRQYEEKCHQVTQAEPVENIPEEQLLSMEELQQQEAVLERELITQEEHLRQMNTTILQYSELMEECEKWEMEKQDMEERLEEYQAKYKMLEKTLKYLKTAQEEFSTRYLKKMNEGFVKYASLLGAGRIEHSSVDIKLAVKTDQGGAKREIGYFSTGLRESMEMCTRLALVDALFDKERPFVVLDDPFVNSDEKAMEGARKLLGQIAEQYQLIYFTCHPSRR